MKNLALVNDTEDGSIFSFSHNVFFHINRLKKLVNKERFRESDIKKVVEAINCLSNYKEKYVKHLIENLVNFKKEVPWYMSEDGTVYLIGTKEIGYEVRLASINALENIGDYNSISKISIALEDRGDMDKEAFEERWYVYRSGVEIQELAKKVISKLRNKN